MKLTKMSIRELRKRLFPYKTRNRCVTCGATVNELLDFTDIISYDEWKISHMCQSCQDETFGAPRT